MTGGVNLSAASIYQIDERGLELRRSYMRMTPAEFELLGGMQAWAARNADAVGKALAEHTFSVGPAGDFLRAYAEGKGITLEALKKGWGTAQAGHFQDIFKEAANPGGFGVKYFEGLLGVGALHSKINLPLKWFLGTYPVFLDLVHEAMLADVPEPMRVEKKFLGRVSKSTDYVVMAAAERALSRIFNYDSQAIVEAFYYDTFASMGVNLRMMGQAGPGRDISDLFGTVRNTMHETLQTFGASTFEVQDMCSSMNVRLSETGQAINELAESASRVAEGAARQADVASQGRNAVEQASNAANGATDLSRNGIEAAMGATAALNDARERIEEAATAITALAGRSAQVGGIVDAIQDIARQTNLLALNAAIEAARAGERGKGFAVVADEVRQLAERAAQSAADAGDLIAGIQGETDAAVELVRDAATRTHAGTEASGIARTTLEAIDGSIGLISVELEGMSKLTADIATYAEETAASAQQMSATTQQTNASTQEIVSSVEQLSSHSERLSALTEQLDLAR
jgi:methyl-accepting chemotaxis protein